MADPYQFFLTSMSAAGLQQTSLQGLQPPLPPVPQQSVETPMLGEFITQPPAQLQEASSDGTKTPSGRRKSSVLANPAIDAVKHRRTRSGCFTCRSRRVKVCVSLKLPEKTGADPKLSVTRRGRYASVRLFCFSCPCPIAELILSSGRVFCIRGEEAIMRFLFHKNHWRR